MTTDTPSSLRPNDPLEHAPMSAWLDAQAVGTGDDVTFKVIAITDETELLQAQRHFNSESSRLQWQALNAGVVISDARRPDMPIIHVNPMFETMRGYTSAEVLGRNGWFLQGKVPNQAAELSGTA